MDQDSQHPIAEVIWEDACYQYDAEGLHDLPEPMIERTVGHLLRNDEDVVTIAQTRDEFGYRAIVTIPKAYILKFNIVKESEDDD